MRVFLLLAGMLFITSCGSSSKLLTSWSSPQEEAKTYKKLLVMAVFPNMETRAAAENAMVEELNARGIRAKVTFDAFPMAGNTKELIGMARDSATLESLKQGFREKVKRKEADGLMIISAFDVQKTKEYHQGGPSLVVAGPAYGYYPNGYNSEAAPFGRATYYDYYGYNVGAVQSKGYYTTSATYYLQTNLFDVESEQMIYSVQSKTVDYKDLQKETALLSQMVAHDMAEKNVLAFKDRPSKK